MNRPRAASGRRPSQNPLGQTNGVNDRQQATEPRNVGAQGQMIPSATGNLYGDSEEGDSTETDDYDESDVDVKGSMDSTSEGEGTEEEEEGESETADSDSEDEDNDDF